MYLVKKVYYIRAATSFLFLYLLNGLQSIRSTWAETGPITTKAANKADIIV